MEAHGKEVYRKILDTAKRLAIKDGYKKTTIRQIQQESGYHIGSIYFLFKNKEEIFKAVLASLVLKAQRKIEEACSDESPAFKYAAVCEVELRTMASKPITRETYFEGYTSKLIFREMVDNFAALAKRLFAGTSYECAPAEYYQKSLLIKGAMYACIAEMYFAGDKDFAASREEIIRVALAQFKVPEPEIDEILVRLRQNGELWLRIGDELAEQPFSEEEELA